MPRFLICFLTLFTAVQGVAQKVPLINSGEVLQKAAVLADSGQHDLAIKELLSIPSRDTNYLSSQTRLAEYYNINKQYDEAGKIADRVLKQRTPYRASMLCVKAHGFEMKKEYDKSLEILRAAAKEYPLETQIRYQIATTYHNMLDYENAVKAYFDVLAISPFSSNTHLNLGNIASWTGQKAHAMFAWGVYLSLKNTDNSKLVVLENLASNQLADENTSTIKAGVNACERLDQILRSKIAMDKKFKTTVEVDAALVKQYEMILQQLNTISADIDDPWVKFYLPIYSAIRDQKLVEPFTYHILASAKIEAVSKWTSKNEKALQSFYDAVNTISAKYRSNVAVPASFGLGPSVYAAYGDDNDLRSIGTVKDGKESGKWIFFHPNGEKNAEGKYEAGKKVGVWNYFHDDGAPNSTENLDTGEITEWYPGGEGKHIHYFIKGESVEGLIEFFHPCGTVSETRVHKDGLRTGKAQMLYESGVVKSDFAYVDDKLTGPWIDYDVNGKMTAKTLYQNGVREGEQENYWQNGKVKEHNMYKAGKLEGPSAGFDENGKPVFKGSYLNDNPVGEWFWYGRKGELLEHRNYNNNGERDKDTKSFRDGKPYQIFTYSNGKLIQLVFYNRSGKEVGKSGSPDGNFKAKQYYPSGELWWDGQYKDGKRDSKWNEYFINGNLKAVYQYKEGNYEGEQIDYRIDGTKERISNYIADKREGYGQEFHLNGQVSREGWHSNDEPQQQWMLFDLNGTKRDDTYYINGVARDSAYRYSVEGDLISRRFYSGGAVVNETAFDAISETYKFTRTMSGAQSFKFANGKERAKYTLDCGKASGSFQRFYPDGTPFEKTSYKSDLKHGPFEIYNHDGSVYSTGSFDNGVASGLWTSNNEVGQVAIRLRYRAGETDSILTDYYDHGGAYLISEYDNGKRNGISSYLAPDGTVLVERKYYEDDLEAIRWRGKNGQMGDWVSSPKDLSVTAYYAGGTKAYEETFAKGVLQGVKRVYYPNGKICFEYNYSNGFHSGPFVSYYPNGKVCSKGQIKFGEYDGVMETFNENGTPRSTITYKLGQKSGPAVYFTGAGKKEIFYYDNLPLR